MNKQHFSIISFFRNLFKKDKAPNIRITPQFDEDIDWESVPNQ